MRDYVNEWLAKQWSRPIGKDESRWICPRLECKSGLSLSIQASQYHYCVPRSDTGPWIAVEVGYPSRKLRTLRDHADDLKGTVYGYVPIDKVNRIIARNGGPKEKDA